MLGAGFGLVAAMFSMFATGRAEHGPDDLYCVEPNDYWAREEESAP